VRSRLGVGGRRALGRAFSRRLIAERRITFVRVGRHVRIPESAIDAMIEAGTVQAIDRRHRGRVA
jgi:excisionase family DNA binding protein